MKLPHGIIYLSDCLDMNALILAWGKVKANGGAAGGDGVNIRRFEKHLLANLTRLAEDVKSGAYWQGPLRVVDIPKKRGGYRTLRIPCISDRVLQTAVAQRLQPVFEAEFEPVSYGYRPGRSVGQAVSRISMLRRQGFKWTLDADIRRFFDSVPHDGMMERLEEHISDPALLALIQIWLETAGVEGRGLAQGSPLSPLLANLYLDEVDEALQHEDVRLVRFADDFVILTKSQDRAVDALQATETILKKLGLELNYEKTRIVPFDEGLRFLGRLFVRSMALEDSIDVVEEPSIEHAVEASSLDLLEKDRDVSRAPRLRVLYLIEKDRVLSEKQGSFRLVEDGEELAAIPTARIDRIEIGPQGAVDDQAIRLALLHDIDMAWIDGHGAVLGGVSQPSSMGARTHVAQALVLEDPVKRIATARCLVEGRIRNQRALLRRLNRRRKNSYVANVATKLGRVLKTLSKADTIEALMGREGQAAALYWPALGACLEHGWSLDKRERRPPPDPVNLAVSYLSSMLARDVGELCARHGLQPGIGALHAIRDDGREGLALDLMEEFRAPLVEGLVVWMFNSRVLRQSMFVTQDDGRVWARPEAIRALIRGWEGWLDRPVRSPRSGQDVLWRGLIEDQVLNWRDHVLGEGDYLPYKMDY